ncbi:hypothetical protein DVH24_014037 [Malus domestica]|uniref:Uncharacterized protein n=1 Tax=Malus domestica TaxID=3750 RepID=A0A498JJH4_MALDO|nr:hypothetical protein DVH24_014037 [Malus domestica]
MGMRCAGLGGVGQVQVKGEVRSRGPHQYFVVVVEAFEFGVSRTSIATSTSFRFWVRPRSAPSFKISVLSAQYRSKARNKCAHCSGRTSVEFFWFVFFPFSGKMVHGFSMLLHIPFKL